MERNWLQERVTVEENELEHLVIDDRLGPGPVPFGFNNKNWQALKESIRDDNDLWTFLVRQ